MMRSSVPPEHHRTVNLSVGAAGLLIALHVASRSLRDAVFCASFSAADLPKVMVLGALLAGAVALVGGRAYARFGPRRVASALLVVNSIGFIAEYVALDGSPKVVAAALYLHTSALSGTILSGFWSLISERFDPHTMRVVMPRIGLGTTLGGLAGGLFAERVAALSGARDTLIGLSILSLVGALMVSGGRAGQRDASLLDASAEERPGLASPYLRRLALFVALTALASSVADFSLKVRAIDEFREVDGLVRFFGLFYTGTSFVAFVFQLLLTPRVLEKAGLRVALAGLPGALTFAAVGALAFPSIAAQSVVRGVDAVLNASLHRSAYEPLFAPLPTRERRSAKALVDVVADKLGDALGSLLVWALVLAFPLKAAWGANALIVPLSLVTMFVATRIYQGYVAELASSLRSGKTELTEEDIADPRTMLMLSRTFGALDRERLLEGIRRLREGSLQDTSGGRVAATPRASPNDGSQEFLELAKALGSPDPERVTRALDRAREDPRTVALVLPLLTRNEVGNAAMQTLAAFGDRIAGQLGDALLDPDRYSAAARRRLARVLSQGTSERAAASLLPALADPDFQVRAQVAQALVALKSRGTKLSIDGEVWVSAAKNELTNGDVVPLTERLDCVFSLLKLAYDSDALELARRAMSGPNAKLRGTALEYLENVLPVAVRGALFQALNAEPPAVSRPQDELLDEMKRTLA